MNPPKDARRWFGGQIYTNYGNKLSAGVRRRGWAQGNQDWMPVEKFKS
jgi:hypothetical protein